VDAKLVSISKFLSLVLRHKPEAVGITLDDSGYVDVEVLLAACAAHGRPISRAELFSVVRDNDKQRFAVSADQKRIRANQGHSVAVELDHTPCAPPEILYHGTVLRFIASIRKQGLLKGARHHVHLSASRDVAVRVGERRGRPIILQVRAQALCTAGYTFFRTPNDVWLVEHVPAQYLIFP
jgi:putative RNA 2'-phosphotransferase